MNRNLNDLDPAFKVKVELFMKEASALGIFITEGYRTAERQNTLYSQRLSHLDGVKKRSLHQLGRAIDIAFRVDRYGTLYPSDKTLWDTVYDIAEKYGINCGYRMWKWDRPHLEDNFQSLTINTMPEFDAQKTASEWGKEAEDALKWYQSHEISSVQDINDLRDAIKFYRFSRR